MKFSKTKTGLYVPEQKPEPKQEKPSPDSEFPVLKGWEFSMCTKKRHSEEQPDFRKATL